MGTSWICRKRGILEKEGGHDPGFGIWGVQLHVHASAYAWNVTCAKKSMPCLIKKGSRCVADRTSKTTFFIFLLLYSTKILQENHVYLFVIWLVQWWKLYCIYILFTQRTIDFHWLKRNINDGTIVFLTSLLVALTWNILLLFFSEKG